MTMNQPGCSYPQAMVDRPKFEGQKSKGRRENQVVGKSGVIRKDKRLKTKYF